MAPRASLAATILLVPVIGLLGWLSVASAIAVFVTLPSNDIVVSAETQVPVSADKARIAAAANISAARWFEGSRYRLHAARTLLALSVPARTRELPRVERITRLSLAAAPMSSYGWTLLSFLRLQRGDVAGAARAWEMSVLVGRYVPNLMQSRLLLGIKIFSRDRSLADAFVDQIRFLAEADPRTLALTARYGGIEAPVRAVLSGTDQAASFERETRLIVAGAAGRLKRRGVTP
jgi:hypothetical protein